MSAAYFLRNCRKGSKDCRLSVLVVVRLKLGKRVRVLVRAVIPSVFMVRLVFVRVLMMMRMRVGVRMLVCMRQRAVEVLVCVGVRVFVRVIMFVFVFHRSSPITIPSPRFRTRLSDERCTLCAPLFSFLKHLMNSEIKF